MRKILSILTALILIMALLVVPASAAGAGTLALSGAEGKQGDTVTLNVNLNSNPGLITMRFTVSWGDGLELTGVANSGVLAGWTPPAPTISSPYTLRWAESLANDNNTKTGKIATLTFKIKDNATVGNKTVTLTFSESRDSSGSKNTFGNATATVKVNCKTHKYGSYTRVNDNSHKHMCSDCGYEETANHTWDGGKVTKQATCKETGVKTYTCTACKATKTEIIAKTNNHTWGNWNTTKQPTCTTPGTATKTCSTCGKTENQTINATGHSMGAWSQSKAPTCTANGEEKRGCSKCNHTETRTVKALGHSFSNPTVTKQPTCTETGVETGKCTRCGQTTTNTIKAKGHKFGEWTDTKAATCTEGGVQERKCTVCDTAETRNTEALGHDFENPTIVKEPSISNTGLKEGKCKRCGETTSEIIPCSVKDDTTGTLFEANEGVFTAGTELKIEEIKQDNPTFESAKNILKDVCNEFILYDITAVLNGAKVQPNGEVTVTFNIPDGFGKDVEVFFVSDDGTYEKLESEVNEDGKTITARLNHFSNYAVCKVSDSKAEISTDKAEPEISTDKTENAKNNNVLYLIIAALAIAVIVGVTVFIMKKKKQI